MQGASSQSSRMQFMTKLADKGINSRLAHSIAYQKHHGTTQRCIDVSQNALQNAAELVEA